MRTNCILYSLYPYGCPCCRRAENKSAQCCLRLKPGLRPGLVGGIAITASSPLVCVFLLILLLWLRWLLSPLRLLLLLALLLALAGTRLCRLWVWYPAKLEGGPDTVDATQIDDMPGVAPAGASRFRGW